MDLAPIIRAQNTSSHPARPADRKLKDVTQEFEAILIASLLKDAGSSPQSGLFAGGLSHDLYQQLFIDEVAKAMARSGGIGVGKMLERQLQKTLGAVAGDNQLKKPSRSADVASRTSE